MNEIIKNLKIIDTNIYGNGIAKYDNKVIFVNKACTGDILDVNITKDNKSYSFASISNMLSASEFRNSNFCSCCGGCPLAHINYAYQVDIKSKYIEECFKKNDINITIDNTFFDQPFRYRNKAVFHYKNNKFGYYESSSNIFSFPKNNDCLLLPLEYKAVVNFFNDHIDNSKLNPTYLYLRNNIKNELIITLGLKQRTDYKLSELVDTLETNFSFISSFYVGYGTTPENSTYEKILGNDAIFDDFNNLKVKISPQSFYQVNHNMAVKLVQHVVNIIKQTSSKNVIDLFCGIGLFGLSVAKNIKNSNVFGIEINPASIFNANENAKNNNINNIKFYLGDSSIFVKELKNIDIDTVILDPPRFGCNEKTIKELLISKPKHIIYISCNPISLASNCKSLSSSYSIDKTTAFDMFPNTSHIETVCLLSKKDT